MLDAFAIFEGLCLLGNGEHPQFLQLECLCKTFSLELIESKLTSYHGLFRRVRVSSSSSFLTGNPYIAVIFTAPESFLIMTSPLPGDAFRALCFPSHAPRDSRRLSLYLNDSRPNSRGNLKPFSLC